MDSLTNLTNIDIAAKIMDMKSKLEHKDKVNELNAEFNDKIEKGDPAADGFTRAAVKVFPFLAFLKDADYHYIQFISNGGRGNDFIVEDYEEIYNYYDT